VLVLEVVEVEEPELEQLELVRSQLEQLELDLLERLELELPDHESRTCVFPGGSGVDERSS